MASRPSDELAGETPVESIEDKEALNVAPEKPYLNYSAHIHKVLTQAHPKATISANAMEIINSFVNDIFERIASEASKVAAHSKKSTITAREIQAAVCILLSGDLSRQAVSEANKAIHKSFPPK
ncbi:histone H2B [Coemansia sp. BCRC 34490]|nr:histone H2B [Coemansia sp. BCRC 34490]